MRAADHQVLDQLCRWLTAGERLWYATVVATWGSSPRPVGSLFACTADGRQVGSLSGGCVEDDLLAALAAGGLAAARPQFFRYGETAEESERLGLPCGGSLDIVIEPLAPDDATREHFAGLRDALEHRRHVCRELDARTGRRSLLPVDGFAPLRWDHEAQRLTHVCGPSLQLFIIGAGMVSRYLAEMAQTLEYAVTVCDPRPERLAEFDVPGVRKIADMPDDAIRAFAADPASAVVALTHDPRIDDMGLMEALTTQAFYVGAMGSSRTSAARRERLAALDLSAAELDRLHAPIGLDIGSKTPPEIAIAILAELTAVRRRHRDEAEASLLAAASA